MGHYVLLDFQSKTQALFSEFSENLGILKFLNKEKRVHLAFCEI